MLIMNYAKGGDLHKYLQKDFTNTNWKKILEILWRISEGYLYSSLLIVFIDYHLCY